MFLFLFFKTLGLGDTMTDWHIVFSCVAVEQTIAKLGICCEKIESSSSLSGIQNILVYSQFIDFVVKL